MRRNPSEPLMTYHQSGRIDLRRHSHSKMQENETQKLHACYFKADTLQAPSIVIPLTDSFCRSTSFSTSLCRSIPQQLKRCPNHRAIFELQILAVKIRITIIPFLLINEPRGLFAQKGRLSFPLSIRVCPGRLVEMSRITSSFVNKRLAGTPLRLVSKLLSRPIPAMDGNPSADLNMTFQVSAFMDYYMPLLIGS